MKFAYRDMTDPCTPFTQRTTVALLPVVLSVLLLTACGSGSTDSSANGPTGSTSGDTGGADAGASTGGTNDSGVDGGSPSANPQPGSGDGGGTGASDGGGNELPDNPGSEEPEIDEQATSFFFSYDESASTASRDLALNALANGNKPNPSLGRPYEFLNAEQIGGFGSEPVGPFNVSMGLLRSENGDIPLSTLPDQASVYGLGVHISGPTLNLNERDNVVLTVLLDTSGSMNSPYAAETRNDITTLLDVAKVGLNSMQLSLKQGDVVNLVTFATEATVLVEDHRPTPNSLSDIIQGIETSGSTDIENGLNLAYQVANRTYDVDKTNRVVIVTDAYVNTGVVDPNEIARHTTINGLEGIYFSGVGVGFDFNDTVLNTLTDVGKGSYSAMITPQDAERIFTFGFSRFLSPAVRDVRFQLTYPQEMDQLKSFAEEISTVAEDVQTINFSYNSSQFFLELFSGPATLTSGNELRLDITYMDDADQGQAASLSKDVDSILGQGANEIKAAAAVATLAQLINGNLDCNTVLSSNLYNSPIQHSVYMSYRQHIERFCSL